MWSDFLPLLPGLCTSLFFGGFVEAPLIRRQSVRPPGAALAVTHPRWQTGSSDRPALVTDLRAALVCLASDVSMTGHNLVIDGGQSRQERGEMKRWEELFLPPPSPGTGLRNRRHPHFSFWHIHTFKRCSRQRCSACSCKCVWTYFVYTKKIKDKTNKQTKLLQLFLQNIKLKRGKTHALTSVCRERAWLPDDQHVQRCAPPQSWCFAPSLWSKTLVYHTQD